MKRPACQVALLATVFVFPFVLSVTEASGINIPCDKSFVKNYVSSGTTSNYSYQVIDSSSLISEAPPPGGQIPHGKTEEVVKKSCPPISPVDAVAEEDVSTSTNKLSNSETLSLPREKLKESLVVSNSTPKQGDVVKVTVAGTTSQDSEAPFITFAKSKVRLFPESKSNTLSCLIGIPVTINPGKHAITYGGKSISITVVNAKYPIRNLRLPKTKNNFKASVGEKETIKKAKENLTETKLWTGKFERPVKKSRISSVFGIRRRVNGKLLDDYFHSGTDFAAAVGTTIYACAPGKVIVAKTGWKLHGNTVCIDHGQGVVSIYIHMNSVSVKEGQTVKAGQKIGAVGQTGRASGPHLHFGVYVNNVATDPMNWFSKIF